ncbi:MAG: type II toxin-antitoxin system VapC family toxin [Candidatus Xenobia bacterium]
MRALLLDTHSLLWWLAGSPLLGKNARAALDSPDRDAFFSLASIWEIAIKISLGKLTLSMPVQDLPAQLKLQGIQPVLVEVAHCARVASLPFHHRDPFDRMLVAQALQEDLTLVSRDGILDLYGIDRTW